MRVVIPHELGRAEARRRLRERSHEIASFIPGGVAQVRTDWPDEDRMTLAVAAMGQSITGRIEVGEREVVFDLTLPPALSFVEPMIEGTIRQKGTKLLK
jgi:hypothetical protein